MTQEEELRIREIIREELSLSQKIDRVVFEKNIQILDNRKIQAGKTNGLMIGTEQTQKIGFHGATPTVLRGNVSQALVNDTSSTNINPYGYATSVQANGIVTLVNELRTSLVEKGIIKGS